MLYIALFPNLRNKIRQVRLDLFRSFKRCKVSTLIDVSNKLQNHIKAACVPFDDPARIPNFL